MNEVSKSNLRKWKAGKIPAFLIESPKGEIITFDQEEANEIFTTLDSEGLDYVTMWTANYDPYDPIHIHTNGEGLIEYLRYKQIRHIEQINLTEPI